jgi:hypothetical protein
VAFSAAPADRVARANAALRAPDIFKRLRAHRRVSNRVGDAGVAEEVLEPSGIHPTGRQAYPVEWRSIWTWTGNGSLAASPARSIMRPIPIL